MIELILAANKIAGLDARQAQDVPYSWLLRFRTQLWYLDGIGAKPAYRTETRDKGRALQ